MARNNSSSTRARPLRAIAILTAVVAAATPTMDLPQAVAAGSPNLTVTGVSIDRTTVTEGNAFKVKHVVNNSGTAGSGSSTTRFYLSTGATTSLAERRTSKTNPALHS